MFLEIHVLPLAAAYCLGIAALTQKSANGLRVSERSTKRRMLGRP